MEPIVFRSKVDRWLIAVLVGSTSLSLLAAASLAAVPSAAAVTAALIGAALGGGLPLWLLLSTRYVLSGSDLRIRCGPFGWSIRLSGIRSISHTRDASSAPALSLDRLRIEYDTSDAIMISPADQSRFLSELKARGVFIA